MVGMRGEVYVSRRGEWPYQAAAYIVHDVADKEGGTPNIVHWEVKESLYLFVV